MSPTFARLLSQSRLLSQAARAWAPSTPLPSVRVRRNWPQEKFKWVPDPAPAPANGREAEEPPLAYKPEPYSLKQSGHYELAYAERQSALEKLTLCLRLQQIDGFSMGYVAEWTKILTEVLGGSAMPLTPLFTDLAAVLNLRAIYAERRLSLRSQEQSASHASQHLEDSIVAIDQLDRSMPMGGYFESTISSGAQIDGHVAQGLVKRFEAQIEALQDEAERARQLLASIEPTAGPQRMTDVILAAKQEDIEAQLKAVIENLKAENLQMFYRERSEADNLEALW